MHDLSRSFHCWFEHASAVCAEPQDHIEVRELSRDVVIVGSGYGGSVAAARLARALYLTTSDPDSMPRVCVIERGREYHPGQFPESIGELPSHVSVAGPARASDIGYAGSLFQIRNSAPGSNEPVYALTGCGLGGGSLINANVAVEPSKGVWSRSFWPRELGSDVASLPRWFEIARAMLRVAPIPAGRAPRKLRRLEETAAILAAQIGSWSAESESRPRYRVHFTRPELTVAFDESPRQPGDDLGARHACTSCGNCATGCNVGAKHTLSTTYLRMASAWNAEMVTGGTVELVKKPDLEDGDFEIWVIPTELASGTPPRRRVRVKARMVILAAGAIGTPELLLRSPSIADGLPMLGKRFGTNGDSISAHYGHDLPVNVQGHGLRAPLVENRETLPGPTITGMIRIEPELTPSGREPAPSYTIEDAGIPSALSTLLAETLTTLNLPREMGEKRSLATLGAAMTRYGPYTNPGASARLDAEGTGDPIAVDPDSIAHSQVFLTMTRDPANWELRIRSNPLRAKSDLAADNRYTPPPQTQIRRTTTERRSADATPLETPDPLDALDAWMASLTKLGGRYLPNPLREPFPKMGGFEMTGAGSGRGRLTVHPLGGCVMADSRHAGVVNHRGQVFDGSKPELAQVIKGLYVLDGAVIPGSLETNPLLTITALAERATNAIIRSDLSDRISGLDESKLELATDLERPPLAGAPKRLAEPPHLWRSTPPEPRLSRLRFRERLYAELPEGDALRTMAANESASEPTARARDRIARADHSRRIGPEKPHIVVDLKYEPADLKTFLERHPHRAPLTGTLRIATSPMDEIRPYLRWQTLMHAPLENGSVELFSIRPGNADSRAIGALSNYACRRMLVESIREALADQTDPEKRTPEFKPSIGACTRAAFERLRAGNFPEVSSTWSMFNFASHVGIARTITYVAETRIDGEPMRFSGRKDISYRLGSNVWRDLGTLDVRLTRTRQDCPTDAREFWRGSLTFDGAHLVREGLPQVVHQLDLPSTIESLIRFAMLFVRAIFQVYFWEFTPADYPRLSEQSDGAGLRTGVYQDFCYWEEYQKRIDMPGALRDGTSPERVWLEVVPKVEADGTPVDTNLFGEMREVERLGQSPSRLRFYGAAWAQAQIMNGLNGESLDDGRHALLHVYRHRFQADSYPPTVLLLHGFALASTMYASRALPNGLAEHLYNTGFDVYVADMRTSFMLPGAVKRGITFDEVALRDIPAMIDFVRWDPLRNKDEANAESAKVSVVAHCMGSAQFGMYLLTRSVATRKAANRPEKGQLAPFYRGHERFDKLFPEAYRDAVNEKPIENHELIQRAAFFQVSPLLAVTPNNSLRAELAAIMDEFIGNDIVSPWLKADDVDNAGMTLIDRIASTLAEADPVEPMRGGYQRDLSLGVTRRAFLLYGRTWVEKNLASVTRRSIDQIIGPVNLRSYRQSGYFALSSRVVDKDGRNRYVNDEELYSAYRFPSLWMHGSRSDMFDARTVQLFPHRINVLASAIGDKKHWAWVKPLEGYGHLDSLIGSDATEQFEDVARFLRNARPEPRGSRGIPPEHWLSGIGGLLSGDELDTLFAYESDRIALASPRCGPTAGSYRTFRPDARKDSRPRRRLWFQLDHSRSRVPTLAFTVCIKRTGGRPSVRTETLEFWHPRKSTILDCSWVVCDALAANAEENEFSLVGAVQEFVRVGDLYMTAIGKGDGFEPLSGSVAAAADGLPVIGDRIRPRSGKKDPDSLVVGEEETNVLAVAALIETFALKHMQTTKGGELIPGVFEPLPIGGTERSILVGSCVYPGLGICDSLVAQPFNEMRRLVDERQTPAEAAFLIGDSVYLDAFNTVVSAEPAGTRPRTAYEKLMRSDNNETNGIQRIAARLPIFFAIDDHEYRDNFAGGDSPEDLAMAYAYAAWQVYAWPTSPAYITNREALDPPGKLSRKLLLPPAGFSYPTTVCGCPAFVLDIRSFRNPDKRTLWGHQQLQSVRHWAQTVAKNNVKSPKLLFCGAPIFPFSKDQQRDFQSGWRDDVPSVYEDEVAKLLGILVEYALDPVIIVSGDLHLSATAEGTVSIQNGATCRIVSVVSSGLFSPLPFANTSVNDLTDAASHVFGNLTLDYRTTWASDVPGFVDLRFTAGDGGEISVSVYKYGASINPVTPSFEVEKKIRLLETLGA